MKIFIKNFIFKYLSKFIIIIIFFIVVINISNLNNKIILNQAENNIILNIFKKKKLIQMKFPDKLNNKNLFKIYPKISILIEIQNEIYNNMKSKLLKILNNFKNIDDFEIILFISQKLYKTIKQYAYNWNNINIVIKNNNSLNLNLFHFLYKVNGRFIILFNDFLLLEKDFLYKLYNNTIGKKENIYNFNITKSNKTIYLIKTKILRDIYDNGIYFNKSEELIKYLLSLPILNINYIYIAFCLDNAYIINTYVALLSILENKNFNTFIYFYILIPKNFTQENIEIISSLYEQYDSFNISFIRIDNRFDKAKMNRYITKSAYFKLVLEDFLPNLNKIIYMDSDIIAYKDLYNLYNHNFNGYLILAVPIYGAYKKYYKYLTYNSGVLLLNLKKMREIKFSQKVQKIMTKGFFDTIYKLNDQGIMNKFFNQYIGKLEPEYNMRFYLLKYNSKYYLRKRDYINYINSVYSDSHPSIFHFTGKQKPFRSKRRYSDDWWYYATKGKYLIKLINKFKKP